MPSTRAAEDPLVQCEIKLAELQRSKDKAMEVRQADEAKLEARLQRKVVAQAERAAKKLARRAQKERLRLQKQLGSAFAKEEELGD